MYTKQFCSESCIFLKIVFVVFAALQFCYRDFKVILCHFESYLSIYFFSYMVLDPRAISLSVFLKYLNFF